ncbi:MAG: hypothetical protein JWO46_235 [Nocardioidaceae bacterium]|nr:hypothetical protein [Nocardioidaceae bacterium]
MAIEVRKAGDRFRTDDGGRTTEHSFSFGTHYDPANVGFGLLVAHNDEHLPPGTGYAAHPHRDLEIVTVVLSGALRHTSEAGSGVLGPGGVQRLSAGSGVVHAEVADDPAIETRFVQTWLPPTTPGTTPSYARRDGVTGTGLVPLAGGDADLGLGVSAALLRGVADGVLVLPDAARMHLFVVTGAFDVGGHALGAGDAVRLSDEGGREVGGTGELLVWVSDGR